MIRGKLLPDGVRFLEGMSFVLFFYGAGNMHMRLNYFTSNMYSMLQLYIIMIIIFKRMDCCHGSDLKLRIAFSVTCLCCIKHRRIPTLYIPSLLYQPPCSGLIIAVTVVKVKARGPTIKGMMGDR